MKIRSILRFSLHVVAIADVLYLAPWLAGIANAATDPGTAVTAAVSTLSLPEWIGIGLAALAGIKAIVDGALAFFRYLAPKTQTTVDDTIRDDLQLAHDKLDGLTALVQSIAKPVVQNITGPARSGQSGRVLDAVMVWIAFVGLIGIALAACGATTKSAATTAEHSLVNCTGQAIGATTPGLDLDTLAAVARTVSAERAKCTINGSLDWQCVERDAIGAGKVLGGCALVELVASAVAGVGSASKAAAARVAAGTTPSADPGRAALEDFRTRVAAGATFHAASGDY